MTIRGRSIARAHKLNRQTGPKFITWVGNPEIRKLQSEGKLPLGSMASNREAMVEGILYVASYDESTEAFHKRMKDVAQQRGKPFVWLGCPENVEPLSKAPLYPPRRFDA